ncbi:MAG: host attachment protein [Candidatus Thiodiazotropha sp.]
MVTCWKRQPRKTIRNPGQTQAPHPVKGIPPPTQQGKRRGSGLGSPRPLPGRSTGNGRSTHGAFNEPTSPKAYEHERFAMELAKELNDCRNHNKFSNLMIVASPHFHGLLNQHMNNHVAKMVSTHLNKDYTDLDEASLIAKLRA